MNLRFPEILGLLLFLATLCSFGLPASASGRIANSLHVVFAPVAGPVQWAVGSRAQQKIEERPREQPIVTDQGGELANLREENRRLREYVETLNGQLRTVARQQAEAGIVGREVREVMQTVRVIGIDAGGGRDILRLAGSSGPGGDVPSNVEKDAVVVARGGIVGRIESVGAPSGTTGASVRMITDRGFRTIGTFGRFGAAPEGGGNAALVMRPLEPRVIVGNGHGEMRVENLTMADVQKSGVAVGDAVFLADTSTQWPMAVHGFRLGTVTYVGERADQPGLAEVRIRPETDLNTLREVGVVRKGEG